MCSCYNVGAVADISVCSYNMQGFHNGVPIFRTLCRDFDNRLLQEHWLTTANLSTIDDIYSNFQTFGVSAVDEKVASSILVGRPFGGVAVVWRKNLSSRMKMLDSDDEEGRFISVKLCTSGTRDVVVTCVCFPCSAPLNDSVSNTAAILAH